MVEIIVRHATKEDLHEVLNMIKELAEFENMPNGPKLNYEDLISDGGYDSASSNTPLFYCNVAEIKIENNMMGMSSTENALSNRQTLTRKIIGYTITFFTYSTWEGKTYFVEDIYVRPEYRKIGVGKKLFLNAIKLAHENQCHRVDFHVLKWNPAKEFYKKMGAINLTETEDWEFYRLNEKTIFDLLNVI